MPLFNLEQHYDPPALQPDTDDWVRPTFKDCAAFDITSVFFNENEHAERHNVEGVDALIILEDVSMQEHAAHWEAGAKQNFDTGLYDAHTVLYIRVADFGDMPVIGDFLTIDEGTENAKRFNIRDCEEESGIYRMILERVRQG